MAVIVVVMTGSASLMSDQIVQGMSTAAASGPVVFAEAAVDGRGLDHCSLLVAVAQLLLVAGTSRGHEFPQIRRTLVVGRRVSAELLPVPEPVPVLLVPVE